MEVDETKAKIYARFNNQVSQDIDRVLPFDSFFFFFFTFSLRKCVSFLQQRSTRRAEIIINHFSQTNARKASNLNKFDEHGTCIVVARAFE